MNNATSKQAESMILTCTPEGWFVTTDDPEVFRLFGTYTLPTAYTAQVPACEVLQAIQRLNPTAKVSIR